LKGTRARAGVESTICTRDFVAAVDAAGGKASFEDMKRYQVEWNEPVSGQFQGYKITLSPTTFGAKNLASL
jgi:gamma-glutamyltranspeptidase